MNVSVADNNPGLSFHQAYALAATHGDAAGLGFAFWESGLMAIDVDGGRSSADGEWEPWAKELRDLALASEGALFYELSLSGCGFHVVGTADPSIALGNMQKWKPNSAKGGGVKAPGFDFFRGKGYIAITANVEGAGGLFDMGPLTDAVEVMSRVATPTKKKAREVDPVQDNLEPRLLPVDELSTQFMAMLSTDRKLQETWAHRREDLKDDSSAYDMSMVSQLALKGLSRQEVWDVVVAMRHKHDPADDKAMRLDYAQSTLFRGFGAAASEVRSVTDGGYFLLSDFWAYLPGAGAKFIFDPTGISSMWTTDAINQFFPKTIVPGGSVPGAHWLLLNRYIVGAVWEPQGPRIMEDVVAIEGDIKPHKGSRLYNTFVPCPTLEGDGDVSPWLDLVRATYPEECEHILDWMAFLVQNPGVKINHALILGGGEGIGKDTILYPLEASLGKANVADISPENLFDSFNPWVQSLLLKVNEARDTGGKNKWKLAEHMKKYITSPPHFLYRNQKHEPAHYVRNAFGVVFTTNYQDALHIDRNSRRYYVAWSSAEKPSEEYFRELYEWMEEGGGLGAVQKWFLARDVSGFNPSAPPEKTAAFRVAVQSSFSDNSLALQQCLDLLDHPPAVCSECIDMAAFQGNVSVSLGTAALRRTIQEEGYVASPNPDRKDGRWYSPAYKKPVVVFVQKGLGDEVRTSAIERLRFEGAKIVAKEQ